MKAKPSPAPRDPAQFYDRLAADYDLMTGFDERFDRERPWFQNILLRFNMTSALDAGCGTGFHSILLSQLGVRMTAVDLSDEMVSRAQANAERYSVQFPAVRSRFSELHEHFQESFDAVFCLGNSIVHLLSDGELLLAFGNFAAALRPSGVLVLQILNYEKILRARREILNEKRAGGSTFVRSYSYGKETITFTVGIGRDQHASGDRPAAATKNSVLIRPLVRGDLRGLFEKTGFTGIEEYGNLQLDAFDPATSSDLVIVASRAVPA